MTYQGPPQYGTPEPTQPMAPTSTYGPPTTSYGPPSQYSYTPTRTSGWAIASLVTSLLGLSLIGVIAGHIGLRESNAPGTDGRGLAIAGLIIGYVGCASWIFGFLIFVVAFGMAGSV